MRCNEPTAPTLIKVNKLNKNEFSRNPKNHNLVN